MPALEIGVYGFDEYSPSSTSCLLSNTNLPGGKAKVDYGFRRANVNIIAFFPAFSFLISLYFAKGYSSANSFIGGVVISNLFPIIPLTF